MTLQEQIENAGGVITYLEENQDWINFLITVIDYDNFKQILEIIEVDIVNNNYVGVGGISYGELLFKGSIQKN